MLLRLLPAALLLLTACSRVDEPDRVTVAAAANLTRAFDEIGREFTRETGIEVSYSYAATTILAQQVQQGAPFDVFASADEAHIDPLVASGHVIAGTRAVYARGVLALWAPAGGVLSIGDLARPEIKFVALANPSLAPYGAAAVEALRNASVWEAVEPKVVYANNINQARQYAATGNAEAVITAYSLVAEETGIVRIDPALYTPIEQVIGVVAGSEHEAAARRYVEFVLGDRGRAILRADGYDVP
jgi:molybdate transport system substrate-binding protein